MNIDFEKLSSDLHSSFREDVAQQALLRLLQLNLDGVRDISRFAHRLAVNVEIDDYRAASRSRSTEDTILVAYPDPLGDKAAQRIDDLDEIETSLRSIAPESASYLRAYYGVEGAGFAYPARSEQQRARRRGLAHRAIRRVRQALEVAS